MKLRGTCALAVILSALIAASCSSGPKPPAVGTPAYYWSAAKETYDAGDYIKTVQHLSNLCRTDNDFTMRATPWRLVLIAGMAKGYMELADNYEFGARANRANSMQFRRQVNDYRTLAGRLALEFAETFEKFETAQKGPEVLLEFSYPIGSAMRTPILTKVASGQMLQPAAAEELRKTHLQTAMLNMTTEAVGAGEDRAKAQQLFKAGVVKVPREAFILAMANALNGTADLYSRTKLDDPKRMEFFATHAMDAVKPLPETKETKALLGKALKTMKLVSGK
ncbi:MAG TPA: hypothetical protein VN428_03650 [Bryobacteraceae bacterium]|nr:hypothetical protein [Bryobacteraceae bacterium]